MAAIVAGIISITLGLVLGIKILIRPHNPSPWLFNTKGIVLSVGLILLGIMILTGSN